MNSKNALYALGGLLMLATVVAAFVSPAGAWPLAILALGAVALANLDRFSEISAGTGGVRAVLRDAQSKLGEVRTAIELLSELQLRLVQQTGRLGTLSDKQKSDYLDRTVSLLREAGVDANRIAEIRSQAWDHYVRFDYAIAVLGGNRVPIGGDGSVQEEWRALRDFDNVPTPAQLSAFLAKIGDADPERLAMLKAYEFYRETGNHLDVTLWGRRPDVEPLRVKKANGN